jgi:hypothetical protein
MSPLNDPAFFLNFKKNFEPIQPIIQYEKVNGRRFNKEWYKTTPWNEYRVSLNAVFGFYCRHFSNNIGHPAFVKNRFNNFKKAYTSFPSHQLI